MSDWSQFLAPLCMICSIPCWFFWTRWGPCRVNQCCGPLRGSRSGPRQFKWTDNAFPGTHSEPASTGGSKTLDITILWPEPLGKLHNRNGTIRSIFVQSLYWCRFGTRIWALARDFSRGIVQPASQLDSQSEFARCNINDVSIHVLLSSVVLLNFTILSWQRKFQRKHIDF